MRRIVENPQPKYPYKTVAMREDTYWKVCKWADYLRRRTGRSTLGETIDYLVDSAGVPPGE